MKFRSVLLVVLTLTVLVSSSTFAQHPVVYVEKMSLQNYETTQSLWKNLNSDEWESRIYFPITWTLVSVSFPGRDDNMYATFRLPDGSARTYTYTTRWDIGPAYIRVIKWIPVKNPMSPEVLKK